MLLDPLGHYNKIEAYLYHVLIRKVLKRCGLDPASTPFVIHTAMFFFCGCIERFLWGRGGEGGGGNITFVIRSSICQLGHHERILVNVFRLTPHIMLLGPSPPKAYVLDGINYSLRGREILESQ